MSARGRLDEARGRVRVASAEDVGLLVVDLAPVAPAVRGLVDVGAVDTGEAVVEPVEDVAVVEEAVVSIADTTPRLHTVSKETVDVVAKAPTSTRVGTKTTQLATQWARYATPPSPQGNSPYDSRINIPIDTDTAQHLNTISHALATTRHKYPLNRSQLITECAQAVIDDVDGHWSRYMAQRDKVMTSTVTALQGRIPTDLHEQIRALGYTETGKRPMGALIALAIKERIGL